jgi:hypothetical protein
MEPEMVAWCGTNEHNFEQMPDPPAYEPTTCARCGQVIVLAEGGFARGPNGYLCGDCLSKELTR